MFFVSYILASYLDTVTKAKNAYKRWRWSNIIKILFHVHISATVVTILREVHYKEHITKVFKRMQKCTILNVKVHGLKYVLEHKVILSLINSNVFQMFHVD
jgi:hypothetical protein